MDTKVRPCMACGGTGRGWIVDRRSAGTRASNGSSWMSETPPRLKPVKCPVCDGLTIVPVVAE